MGRRWGLLLVLLLAGCAPTTTWRPGEPGSSAPPGSADGWHAAPQTPAQEVPAPADPGPPTRLRVPAIGVDTPLETLGLQADGTLATPVDFARAGWFSGGTSPGEVGPAVIAGHVDSKAGPAVFFRLRELKAGDIAEVTRGDKVFTFRVEELQRYPKTRFPTAKVYGPTPDPALRLITCGGDFDRSRRSYVDDIVVYATLAGPA